MLNLKLLAQTAFRYFFQFFHAKRKLKSHTRELHVRFKDFRCFFGKHATAINVLLFSCAFCEIINLLNKSFCILIVKIIIEVLFLVFKF